MENILNIQHDLRRDFHNLYNLLRFLKEDNQILDVELKLMLEKNLERERTVNENLEKLVLKKKD